MLDVRRLLLLRDLAVLGTIAAVAKARSFSTAAVSQQLSTLEREARAQLLDRTTNRVVLTPAGEALVAHAERLTVELDEIEATLARDRGGPSGTLRLAVFPSAARAVVPDALAKMSVRYPGIEIQLTEELPASSMPRLRAGEFDVVLLHAYDLLSPTDQAGVRQVVVHTEPMLLVRPSGAVEADLRDVDWVSDQPGSECREVLVRWCAAAGFAPRIRHQVSDFAVALSLVAAGGGHALIPRLGVRALADGVVAGPVPGAALGRRILAAHREGSGRHPLVEAAVEVFTEVFADLG